MGTRWTQSSFWLGLSLVWFVHSAAYAADVTSGLEFYLPFDSGPVERVSGQSPSRTYKASISGGRFGKGGLFDKGFYEYSIPLKPETWAAVSVALWVNAEESTANSTSLFSTEGWTPLMYLHGKRARLHTGNQPHPPQFEGERLPPNTWVHLAGTWQNVGNDWRVTLYVDGVIVHQEVTDARFKLSELVTRVGGWTDNDTYNLTGRLDDVALYSRTLSPEDVAALAQAPVRGRFIPVLDPSDIPDKLTIAGAGSRTIDNQDRLSKPDSVPNIRIEATDWSIVSAIRSPNSNNTLVEPGEQLDYRVTLRRTGTKQSPLPVRLRVHEVAGQENFNGSNPGTKRDITQVDADGTTEIQVLIGHHRRFYEGSESFRFDFVLENSDGSMFVDATPQNNRLRVDLQRADKAREARAALAAAQRQSNKRWLRLSPIAGQSSVYRWHHVAPKQAVLSRLQEDGCNIAASYEYLGDPKGQQTQPTYRQCDALAQHAEVSSLLNRSANKIVFGLRVNQYTASASSTQGIEGLQFRTHTLNGNRIGSKKTARRQWGAGTSAPIRRWNYCPKDSTGNRMVAVGYELHKANANRNATVVGIRLVCEPLAATLDPTEGAPTFMKLPGGVTADGFPLPGR